MKKSEKGFGALEVLLVLLVIGLLGLVGWTFFSKQKDGKNTNNQASSQQSEQPKVTTTPATATQQWSGFSFDYYKDWGFSVDDTSYDSKSCQGACNTWGGQSQLPGVNYDVQHVDNIGVTARVSFGTSGQGTALSSIHGEKIKVNGVDAVKTTDTNGGNIGGHSVNAYFDKPYNKQQRRYVVWVYGDPNNKTTIDQLFNTILSSWKWQ